MSDFFYKNMSRSILLLNLGLITSCSGKHTSNSVEILPGATSASSEEGAESSSHSSPSSQSNNPLGEDTDETRKRILSNSDSSAPLPAASINPQELHSAFGSISGSCAKTLRKGVICWDPLFLNNHRAGETPRATLVPGLNHVTEIASNGLSHCALTESGRVYCWGLNSMGALGDGTTTDRATPAEVRNLPGKAKSVRMGVTASDATPVCAILQSNQVFCWGPNTKAPGAPNLLPWEFSELNNSTNLIISQHVICGMRPHTSGGQSDLNCVSVSNNDSLPYAGLPAQARSHTSQHPSALGSFATKRGRSILALQTGKLFRLGFPISALVNEDELGQFKNDFVIEEQPELQFRKIKLSTSGACGLSIDSKIICWGRHLPEPKTLSIEAEDFELGLFLTIVTRDDGQIIQMTDPTEPGGVKLVSGPTVIHFPQMTQQSVIQLRIDQGH